MFMTGSLSPAGRGLCPLSVLTTIMPGTRNSSLFIALSATLAAIPAVATARPTTVVIRAADGVAVHGALYPAAKPRATILLFHQAGSGKGEYRTIAPRLAAAGYTALAIDQRSGGSLFGRNETVAAADRSASYLDAERDLEAAFAWAKARKLPVLLWGSSYSGALVFRVAARHPGEVRAVLAFSPGEYLGRPALVRHAAAVVRAPIFVTSAADPGEVAAARAILAASPATLKVLHAPRAGSVHGSATLIAVRGGRSAETAWAAVLAFLRRVA